MRSLALVFLTCAGIAEAQTLTPQGTWTFRESILGEYSVRACRTNAPTGGDFWGGQPLVKALAEVNQSSVGESLCLASATAALQFAVGPEKTLVEFECVLHCDRVVRAQNEGAAGVSGSGNLLVGGRPIPGGDISCKPPGWKVRGPHAKKSVSATRKTTVCLPAGENYEARGGVIAVAEMGQGGGARLVNARANCFVDSGVPGSAHGVMLILQSRGTCK